MKVGGLLFIILLVAVSILSPSSFSFKKMMVFLGQTFNGMGMIAVLVVGVISLGLLGYIVYFLVKSLGRKEDDPITKED